MTEFNPQEYWEARLENDLGLHTVGFLGLGKYYNSWLYRIRRHVFFREVRALPIDVSQCVILDVGCGSGFYVNLWREQGVSDITGVDISEDMLRVARRKARNHAIDLKFRHGDIANLNLRTEFDLILSLGNTVPLIYRIRDARKAFRNFARHLKPGGNLPVICALRNSEYFSLFQISVKSCWLISPIFISAS